MKLSLEMHRALASINAALMKGDQAALESAFDGVNLAQILSQDTIAVTRALGKKPITLLLCTLAEQNGVETARAQHWLACYQSILREKLEAPLEALSRQNVLRFAVESLMQRQSLTAATLAGKKIKGTAQAWQDALELLLDHKDWPSALELLKHLGKQAAETQIWLHLSRSLSRRHPLYVEESGQAQVDVDYQVLARLYSLCADAARRAKVFNVHKALVQLSASALETDGDLDRAIEQLQLLDPQITPWSCKLTWPAVCANRAKRWHRSNGWIGPLSSRCPIKARQRRWHRMHCMAHSHMSPKLKRVLTSKRRRWL